MGKTKGYLDALWAIDDLISTYKLTEASDEYNMGFMRAIKEWHDFIEFGRMPSWTN